MARGVGRGAVLIVGLGRFGSALAEDLERLGHQVLAVDADGDLVQEWSDRLTHTVQADATSEAAMRQLGADQFDRPWWRSAPASRPPCSAPGCW